MSYFFYILLLKIFFFFFEIIHPPGALPSDFTLIAKTVVPVINEASGIADSKSQPGNLWVQEDSGNRNQLN